MEAPTRQKATELLSELDQELARTQGRSARISRVTSIGTQDMLASHSKTGRSASPYRTLSPAVKSSAEEMALSLLDRVRSHRAQFMQHCDKLESRLRGLLSQTKA